MNLQSIEIMKTMIPRHRFHLLLIILFAWELFTCQGNEGGLGPDGPTGPACWDLNGNGSCEIAAEDNNQDGACTVADCWPDSVGTVSGSVMNSLSNQPLTGVEISIDPAVPDTTLTTNEAGKYAISLPTGVYTFSYQKENYTPIEHNINVAAGLNTVRNVILEPKYPVMVDAGTDLKTTLGASVVLTGKFDILDDSSVTGHNWVQLSGAEAILSAENTPSVEINLPDKEAYKTELLSHLMLPDRLMVVGINPDALDKAQTITLEYRVTTTSGVYKDHVKLIIDLPFSLSTGLQNVAAGTSVLVQGKGATYTTSYNWTLTKPDGSSAEIDDHTSRYPVFTPDIAGQYTLQDSILAQSIDVFAELWSGCVHGQDAQARPTSIYCGTTGFCHGPKAPVNNQIFDTWAQSGHAEIFTDNLNHAAFQKESCFLCHTVGYDKSSANNGIDDTEKYPDFIASQMISNPDPDNWTTMLADYPKTAQLTNVQCENCHGPMSLGTQKIHFNSIVADPECVSISSDVCAVCHGQADWNARHQQWQQSAHGSYASALANGAPSWPGGASDCGRCHAGQGFLAWIEAGDLTQKIPGDTQAIGLTPEKVHPISCTTCHDPHAVGNSSGIPNDATVRISGDTPVLPSGFRAIGVGRAAICFVCHTTTSGLHNDQAGPLPGWQAPHASSQADVLMGENAYFVEPGIRSPHAYSIPDTCANCHMVLSPVPEEPGAQGESTNHTFVANLGICASCHADYDPKGLQKAVQEQLLSLSAKIDQDAISRLESLSEIWVRAFDLNNRFSSQDPENCDLKIDTRPESPNRIIQVEPVQILEKLGFIVTLQNPIEITWVTAGSPTTVTTNRFGIQLQSLKLDNNGQGAVFGLTSNMAKAVWNYLLVRFDESYGIHNTRFSNEVISKTMLVDLTSG